MEKMKHTPGPWSIEMGENGIQLGGGEEQYTCIFSESGFGYVAKVLYKKPEILGDNKMLARKTFEANAHLIAAAPDLLEALQSFPGLDCDTEDVIRWMWKQEAAIAKATTSKP